MDRRGHSVAYELWRALRICPWSFGDTHPPRLSRRACRSNLGSFPGSAKSVARPCVSSTCRNGPARRVSRPWAESSLTWWPNGRRPGSRDGWARTYEGAIGTVLDELLEQFLREAAERGLDVDLHVDQTDDTKVFALPHIAHAVRRTNFQVGWCVVIVSISRSNPRKLHSARSRLPK